MTSRNSSWKSDFAAGASGPETEKTKRTTEFGNRRGPIPLLPAGKDYLWGGRRLRDDFSKDFAECYRHGIATIDSVELTRTDAPATKQQERYALEKIKSIVDMNPITRNEIESRKRVYRKSVRCQFRTPHDKSRLRCHLNKP